LLLKKRSKLALLDSTFDKIEKANVLLCGLGGIGSIVASCLVRIGFKNIFLIDNDKEEPSNLNRQLLYDLNDLNQYKVNAPLTKIETNIIYIDSISSLPSKHFDIIIDCIDSVEGKLALFLKSRGDNSVFVTTCGSSFHLDFNKFVYGKSSEASDKLASNFKSRLKEEGIEEKVINNIKCVYAKDNRIKSKPNCYIIPSIC
jgi:tRNA A37 threonylcarbamoyladenosine dehydratase